MTLSKRKMVFLAFVLVGIYFVLLLFLPAEIIGHRDDDMIQFIPKLMFLAVTAAIGTMFVLIFIFKREYIKTQIYTFNRFRHYLRLLVKRDFTAKYRKSILGVVWSLLNPMLTMLVMTLVFSYFFRFEIPYFPVYMLSGFIIYSFFSESTTFAMGSIIASEGIIKKIYVPKYIFPLSKVLSSLVNLFFTFIAFLIVFIFFALRGMPVYWTIILIPIPIFFTFVFSLGVAMLMSSLSVMFRDITYLYGIVTLMLMYFTPIFWPVSMLSPRMAPIIGLNPLFQYVMYFRELALWGTIPDLWSTLVCIGYALGAFCIGTAVFIKQQDSYILSL